VETAVQMMHLKLDIAQKSYIIRCIKLTKVWYYREGRGDSVRPKGGRPPVKKQADEKVTEKELLEDFERIQQWLRQLEEQYPFPIMPEPSSSPSQQAPLVAEPIYRYEIHASN